MHVAITGSSGLIGSHLTRDLAADGHTVHRVVRDRGEVTEGDIYWSPSAQEVDVAAFEGIDAIVNLAGAPIGKRWTDEQKRRIRDSRVTGTAMLADALASLADKPSVLVSASAIGFYGDRGDEILTEESSPGRDFLAQVCQDWETAAEPAERAGIRVVHPRTGIVVAEEGPAMEKMLPPFKLGIGGPVGSGKQWVSWIALEDHIRALRHLLDSDLWGPVNLVGPEPIRNETFARALGEVIRRPTFMRVPRFALRALYGEMGETLALSSQRVLPERLLESDFEFRHASVGDALRAALA